MARKRAPFDVILSDVRAERQRQIAAGYGPEHDDQHTEAQLAQAAATYALAAAAALQAGIEAETDIRRLQQAAEGAWPWWRNGQYPPAFDRATPRERLIQAAALLLAEIEREDRATGEPAEPGGPAEAEGGGDGW